MKNMNKVNDILNINDNFEILEIINVLLDNVIRRIELDNKENMEVAEDYLIDYDLGNGFYIMAKDLEDIVNANDTLDKVIYYNGK